MSSTANQQVLEPIFEMIGVHTHTLNVENCLLYLSSTILQFDFIFYCVTMHTLYTQCRKAL